MSTRTAIHRKVDAWLIREGQPIEYRADLDYNPNRPLLLGVSLWHESTPDRRTNWQVYRNLVRGSLKGGDIEVGPLNVRAVMVAAHHTWMLQLAVRTNTRREVLHVRADDMSAFVEATLASVPLHDEQAWADAITADELIAAKVDEWAEPFRCPRCHRVPCGLLAGCADPICAAEDFRATLALEQRIEATDD
jgi:hypothetical protein